MFLLRGLIRLCGLWPAFRRVVLLVAVCCLGSFISCFCFFFLVGCSGVIDVFSVFGGALWFLCSVFSFAGEFGAGFRGLLFC